MNNACSPFSYSERNQTPEGYVCSCGAKGIRLYREYNTFVSAQEYSCRKCAIERYNKGHSEPYGTPNKLFPINDKESQIGFLVAAVPTEDGETFWGYTSVPEDGCEWWYALPKELV